jgi:hypothetical protein
MRNVKVQPRAGRTGAQVYLIVFIHKLQSESRSREK